MTGPHPASTLWLSPEDTARRLGLSRTAVYTLLRTGELRSMKVRGRRLVFVASIQAYARRLEAR